MPISFESIRCAGGGAFVGGWARAVPRAPPPSGEVPEVDISLLGDDGRVVVTIQGLRVQRVGSARAVANAEFYGVEWQPQPESGPAAEPEATASGEFRVVASSGHASGALVDRLRGLGCRATSLDPDVSSWTPAVRDGDTVVFVADEGVVGSGGGWPDLVAASVRNCDRVLAMLRALADDAASRGARLVVVTCGAQATTTGESPTLEHAPLWGLMRTVANEHAELRGRLIDLPATPNDDDIAALARELARGGGDEVALRDGARLVPRLRPLRAEAAAARVGATAPRAGRAYCVVASTPGILDGLVCRAVARRKPAAGEVEIEVDATGLNFMNVMSALGTYPGYPHGVGPLGIECAGRIAAIGEGVTGSRVGEPVFAIAIDSLASHVVVDARLVRPVPRGLTAEQAAAIPIAFATAHYALVHLGRLQRGERVLIHAAAGGVGLAAIQVARHLGAEVFATAGSPEKRALLTSVGVEHVMDSRSLSFRDELLARTGGEGVDVVLNSLAGDFVDAGLAVLRPYGRFVEIGKKDIYRNAPLGLLPFSRNLSYSALDLDRMIRERPARVGELFDEVLALLASGAYRPLPCTTIPVSRAADAFRDMAQGRHTGKLVLTHGDPELQLDEAAGSMATLTAGTVVITGGLGGLGLAVAGWLAERGATRLALVGRSPANESQRAALDALRARGVQLRRYQVDVSSAAAVRELLDDAERELGPISVVVHAAGVLDDALLSGQDAARFTRVMAPKFGGAWNLHVALESRPSAMLVLFSSVAALLGLAGQGNYAAANAGLDALAHTRRAGGAPAISIDWAPWSGIGMAAVGADRGERLEARGLASLSPAAGLAALERVLEAQPTQVAVMSLDMKVYTAAYPAAAHSALLAELSASGTATAPAADGPQGLKERLLAVEPGRRRLETVHAFLKEQVGKVLRQSAARLDVDKPFRTLGLDSLMGLELRNRLESATGLTLSATMVWNFPTISALARELAARLDVPLDAEGMAGKGAVSGSSSDEDLESVLAEIEQLSSDEASRRLARDR